MELFDRQLQTKSYSPLNSISARQNFLTNFSRWYSLVYCLTKTMLSGFGVNLENGTLPLRLSTFKWFLKLSSCFRTLQCGHKPSRISHLKLCLLSQSTFHLWGQRSEVLALSQAVLTLLNWERYRAKNLKLRSYAIGLNLRRDWMY